MTSIRLENGKRLAYDTYDFTPPWTNPEVVVLVHGFTKHRKYWYKWIPQLAQHYKVIAVDQFGHGESDPFPDDFQMSIRPFSDDLAFLLQGLGIPSAHFVMAEFSSIIALDFAVAHPSVIRSLILPGFFYRIGKVGLDWQGWEKIAAEQGSEAWARATNNVRLPADADPVMREWYVTQQGHFPAVHLAHFCRFARTVDLSDNIPQVSMPALLMTGEFAVHESAAGVRAAAALMKQGQVKIFQGMPMNVMSACPELSIAESLIFLRELRR